MDTIIALNQSNIVDKILEALLSRESPPHSIDYQSAIQVNRCFYAVGRRRVWSSIQLGSGQGSR